MKRAAGMIFAASLACIAQGCDQSDAPSAVRPAAADQAPITQAVRHHARMARHHFHARRFYAERSYDAEAAYAQSYYDYHSSSTVTSLSRSEAGYDSSRHEEEGGFAVVTPGGPPIVYSGDLDGGVGYGSDGYSDGVWVDGYGRRHPRHNFARRPHVPTRARLSAWHGYNSEDGLSNGY